MHSAAFCEQVWWIIMKQGYKERINRNANLYDYISATFVVWNWGKSSKKLIAQRCVFLYLDIQFAVIPVKWGRVRDINIKYVHRRCKVLDRWRGAIQRIGRNRAGKEVARILGNHKILIQNCVKCLKHYFSFWMSLFLLCMASLLSKCPFAWKSWFSSLFDH